MDFPFLCLKKIPDNADLTYSLKAFFVCYFEFLWVPFSANNILLHRSLYILHLLRQKQWFEWNTSKLRRLNIRNNNIVHPGCHQIKLKGNYTLKFCSNPAGRVIIQKTPCSVVLFIMVREAWDNLAEPTFHNHLYYIICQHESIWSCVQQKKRLNIV